MLAGAHQSKSVLSALMMPQYPGISQLILYEAKGFWVFTAAICTANGNHNTPDDVAQLGHSVQHKIKSFKVLHREEAHQVLQPDARHLVHGHQ